jgi:hypothetical protein
VLREFTPSGDVLRPLRRHGAVSVRYRITVRGAVSPRFVSGLGEADDAGTTAVIGEVDTPAQLEDLLARLGDLCLELTSLRQDER